MYSGNFHTTCTLYLLKKLFTLRPLDNLSVEGLVRLWAHEALRLFQDRLVEDVERQWTDENIDNVAMRFFPGNIFMSSLYCVSSSSATCICPLPSIWTSNLSPLSSVVGLPGPRFPSLGLDVAVYPPTIFFSTSIIAFSVPGINRDQALERPILYSNWLSKDYVPVNRDQLREYVKARLKVECRTYIDNLNIGEEVLLKHAPTKTTFWHFRSSTRKNWMSHWSCSMKSLTTSCVLTEFSASLKAICCWLVYQAPARRLSVVLLPGWMDLASSKSRFVVF